MPAEIQYNRNQAAEFAILRNPNVNAASGAFLHGLAQQVALEAARIAPQSDRTSGQKIVNSHKVNPPRRGASGLVASVVNTAPHAMVVARGSRPVFRPQGKPMVIMGKPKHVGGGATIFSQFREGIQPNPWMEVAYNRVVRVSRFVDPIVRFDER